MDLCKYLGQNTPPKKRRLPSSTRPQAASRCRHVPSAQQHYDMPAEERASEPHLGEGGAWKSPSRGRLACPLPVFLRRCPLIFFFRTPTILNFRIALWALEPWTKPYARDHKRACVNGKHNKQHQDQSQQRPAVAARHAQNRQRERFWLGLTMANPAQPESIATNKSAAARLSGVLL